MAGHRRGKLRRKRRSESSQVPVTEGVLEPTGRSCGRTDTSGSRHMSDEAAALPLDSWHRARGGRMVPFAGYAMPVQYEGIMAGPEAEKGLESQLPADLTLLKDGRLRYSLLLNAEGGIIDDLMVTRRGSHFYMVVNGATKAGDIEHLQTRLPRSVVLDHMKEQALLALQGPKAAEDL